MAGFAFLSRLSHLFQGRLSYQKKPNWPVLCLSHLSQSLSQFVSMEAVIPENSQICQLFFVFVSVVSVSTEGFMQEKQPNWPVLRLSHLSHLSHLSQGGLSGSGKKTSVWADQYPFGQTSANPNPPQKNCWAPPPVGADQYQADPLYPLGKPVPKKESAQTRWADQYFQ